MTKTITKGKEKVKKLVYNHGNICIHYFSTEFLERIIE